MKRAGIALMAILGWLILAPQLSRAQTTVDLPATQDNTLYESGTGNLSNGAGAHFFVGQTSGGAIRRGLVSFDVAGQVPAGATIQTVTLTLNMSRSVSGGQDVSLHRVTADWGEGTSDAAGQEGGGTSAASGDATWLHRMFNTDLWTSPGGDFDPTASATQSVAGLGSYTWGSSSGMVADVQAWLDNPSANFGWLLMGNEDVLATAKRFDSRENATPANRPILSVTYTEEVAACCVDRVGDANAMGGDEPTIGDVSVIIDALFITGNPGPLACLAEADINQSGGADPAFGDITIGGVSVLIDYLFITGPSLGLPNCI